MKLSTQEKFTPAFAKPMLCDVAICGIFLDSVSAILNQHNLKIQRPICKSQARKIFRTLKFKNFFGKDLRANFCQRFLVSGSYFSSRIFLFNSVNLRRWILFSRRDSVSDVVSEVSFLSQVRILFSQSRRKWIRTLFSRTFRSGFSFYLITQNRGIYFDAWFLMPYHITEKVFARAGIFDTHFLAKH